MRFLLEWQAVAPGCQRTGAPGVAEVVEQLQGFDLAAGAWESEILTARVLGYRPEWLDPHCLSGQVSWLRLAPPQADADREAVASTDSPRRGRSTSRSTPLSLVLRDDLPWLLQAHRRAETEPKAPVHSGGAPATAEMPFASPAPLANQILALLESRGALFHAELVSLLGARPVEVEAALWDLVSRGRVGADGFQAVRSLLGAREGRSKTRAGTRARRGLRRGLAAGAMAGAEGRWSRVPAREATEDMDGLAEAIAEQLLIRWGIVFRDVVTRENLALPWREIVWALRRLEARGSIRGGRFVSGFTGEQFALPEALEALNRIRRKPRSGERIRVCASDPLNLVGILTPGARVPAVRTREVVYVDGLPVELEDTESARTARSRPKDAEPERRSERVRRRKPAQPVEGSPLPGRADPPAQLELG